MRWQLLCTKETCILQVVRQAVAESCWQLGENGCKVGATLKASLFGWYHIATVDCMKDPDLSANTH